jgi:chitosanase
MGGSFADNFKTYLPRLEDKKSLLADDKKFVQLLVSAAKQDPKFRACEDAMYNDKYYNPAKKWFDAHGFKLGLSFATIFDSFIQSGGMLNFLTKEVKEKFPSDGGAEKIWAEEYLKARNSWLANNSRAVLRTTSYRTEALLAQIKAGNWDFDPPVRVNGVNIRA